MKTEIIRWPKNFCTYKDGPELYSLTPHFFRKYAMDAHAVIRLGSQRMVLIDCRILEQYMMARNIAYCKKQ